MGNGHGMGEILVVIAGMGIVLLRTFQWARKMMVDFNEQKDALQDEVASLNKTTLRLEAKLENCNERRIRATRAANHFKTKWLEHRIENSRIVNGD